MCAINFGFALTRRFPQTTRGFTQNVQQAYPDRKHWDGRNELSANCMASIGFVFN